MAAATVFCQRIYGMRTVREGSFSTAFHGSSYLECPKCYAEEVVLKRSDEYQLNLKIHSLWFAQYMQVQP